MARSGVPLEDVVVTGQLQGRLMRAPDLRQENEALHSLAKVLIKPPLDILNLLVELALKLCNAGSSGVSLLEDGAEGEVFRWVALAGEYKRYTGGSTPRESSPCGYCLDRNAPQLYLHPGRHFACLEGAEPPIVEGLVIPFYGSEQPLGTIWIVSHDTESMFDLEDVRIMTALGGFTAAAVQRLTGRERHGDRQAPA